MTENLFVWIAGGCVIVMAISMIAQAWAGVTFFRLLRPPTMQIADDVKKLAASSQALLRTALPAVRSTSENAVVFFKDAASEIAALDRVSRECLVVGRRIHVKWESFSLRPRKKRK